jgi:VanZ family protein
MSRPTPRAKHWVAPCVWAGLIVLASSVPALGRLPVQAQGSDKLVHFCEFLALGYLVRRAAAAEAQSDRRAQLVTFVLCGAWALLDEAHQMLVPARSPEVLDLLADGVGCLVGSELRANRDRLQVQAREGEGEQHG